jgi:hypothetical protein
VFTDNEDIAWEDMTEEEREVQEAKIDAGYYE